MVTIQSRNASIILNSVLHSQTQSHGWYLVTSRRGCGGALHDWIPHQEAGQVSRLSRLRLWRLLLLLLRIQPRLLLLVEPGLLLLLLVLLMRAVVEVVLVGGRGYGQRVQGRTVVVTNTCHEEM